MNFQLADSPQVHQAPPQPQSLVPASYAEKAMASLLQLHTELMDEKEKRVDLFRTLMEKEQAISELRMYVRMLEEKLAAPVVPEPIVAAAAPIAAAPIAAAPIPVEPPAPPTAPLPPRRVAPLPKPSIRPTVAPQQKNDGWKSW